MIKCNLAVLMAERKLSIQDVADATGLSRTTISALVNENGKGIQFDTMESLCRLLKVQPGELFTFTTFEAEVRILNWAFNGPYRSSSTDLRGNEIEIVIEKAYKLEVNIKIQHDLKFLDENLNLQVLLEFNEKNEVSDIHIDPLIRVYRIITKGYADHSLSDFRGKEVIKSVEDEVTSFIEKDLLFKINPDVVIHM